VNWVTLATKKDFVEGELHHTGVNNLSSILQNVLDIVASIPG
jgi:hypothetical protein